MRSTVHSSPDDIDVTSLWSVLRRSGLKVVGISMAIGALTFGVLAMMPSRYTSEAQIRIGGPGIGDPIRGSKIGNTPSNEMVTVKTDKEAIASRVQELRSPDLARKLTSEMAFNQRPEFNSALPATALLPRLLGMVGIGAPRAGETEEERVLSAYYKSLQVYQVKETRVINVEFTAMDSAFAAKAANRLVELYQSWLRTQGVSETTDASEWLRPEIEKRTKELSAAESAVERFRSEANLFRGGAQNTGLNEQQLTELNTEVTKARTARGEAEARARSARELLNRGAADAISDVQKSPVIQGLIAQRIRAEREKAEAETQLLAGHPRMKQLNANVNDLKRQVNREAATIVEGLEKEAKVLALREELATKSLEESKTRVGNKAGDIARLAALEDDAKAKRRELEALRERYEASRSRGDVKSVAIEAQVITTARPSSKPSSPQRMPISLLATAASMILGFAFVITKELLGGARRQPSHAFREPELAPVSAAVPQPQRGRTGVATASARIGAASAASAAAVAPPAPVIGSAGTRNATPPDASPDMDPIVDRLIANAGGQGGYRAVVAAEDAMSDADVAAADLASALAARGKQVVLVDWRQSGTGLAGALGIDAVPGFTDLIEGRATFEDVIRRLPDDEVHLVPCGTSAVDGAEPNADRVNLVLDALDEAYDFIVVTGEHEAIRSLFLAVQGRFDAGIALSAGTPASGSDTFLGFQVTDIDVIRLQSAAMPSPNRKMQLARGEGARA